MDNKKIILKEVEDHFNEVIIDLTGKLVRLVGFCETNEDYYYLLSCKYGEKHPFINDRFKRLSAVGRLIYLKGFLPEIEYNILDELLSLNGAPKEDKLIIENKE